MSVVIKNIGEFHGQMSAWLAGVKDVAAEAAMGLAHDTFEQILTTAPQNSGDFVANTHVAVGAPSTAPFESEVVGPIGEEMFHVGSTPAMEHARAQADWTPGKLGQSVFISSSAEHDEPYAVKIEEGLINLRPANAGADHIYRNAIAHTARTNVRIGKDQLAKLRRIT